MYALRNDHDSIYNSMHTQHIPPLALMPYQRASPGTSSAFILSDKRQVWCKIKSCTYVYFVLEIQLVLMCGGIIVCHTNSISCCRIDPLSYNWQCIQ